jgi:hypothetical protein
MTIMKVLKRTDMAGKNRGTVTVNIARHLVGNTIHTTLVVATNISAAVAAASGTKVSLIQMTAKVIVRTRRAISITTATAEKTEKGKRSIAAIVAVTIAAAERIVIALAPETSTRAERRTAAKEAITIATMSHYQNQETTKRRRRAKKKNHAHPPPICIH